MESHIKADIEREVYAHNVLNRFKNHIEAPLKEVFKPFEGQNVRRKDETLLAKVKKPLDEKLAELRESFEIKPFFKDGWVKLDAYVKSLASFDVQIVLRLNFQTGVNERSGYSLDAHAFKDDVLYIASRLNGARGYLLLLPSLSIRFMMLRTWPEPCSFKTKLMRLLRLLGRLCRCGLFAAACDTRVPLKRLNRF